MAIFSFVALVLILSAIYAKLKLFPTCKDAVLHPPLNISPVWISASQTRIEWTPSLTTMNKPVVYKISVCDTYGPCFAFSRLLNCRHRETTHTWLEFGSNVDTPYCIDVRATLLCGSDVIVSDPSVTELRTPKFAPGNFQASATATSPTSAKIVAFLPQVKNGALEICYITLHDSEEERTFSCSAPGDVASVTELTDLKPNTLYIASVTFANIHNGREMGTHKTISFKTLDGAAGANNSQIGNDNSERNSRWKTVLAVVVTICFALSDIKGNHTRSRRRRRQRR